MSHYTQLLRSIHSTRAMDQLAMLYGNRNGMLLHQANRFSGLLSRHEKDFHTEAPVYLISAPGRTEIGGNHTDHNQGKVLAAAVNLDVAAAVSPREDMEVHLHSEGYRPLTVDLNSLEINPREMGTTTALIRGVAARMQALGLRIGGFDATATSSVASGSGLSSSAAFETMVAHVFDCLYNGGTALDFKTRAKVGQFAENKYFGKASGLLDQMASSAGGLVAVDFRREDPEVRPMKYDFGEKGYALVVVGTGGSHANLTAEYDAIPGEMRQVAAFFGEKSLRRVRPEEFKLSLPSLYGHVPDRAILRALHFFQENDRVDREVDALVKDDLHAFFREIIASGRSSYMYLQNVYATPKDQSLSIALALAEDMLAGNGAWRIHGGGFAGTTLNFVPVSMLDSFVSQMESIFGERACHILDIRPVGPYALLLSED